MMNFCLFYFSYMKVFCFHNTFTFLPSFDTYFFFFFDRKRLFWYVKKKFPSIFIHFHWDLFYLPIGEIKPNFTLETNDEIKTTNKHWRTIHVPNFLLSTSIIDILCVVPLINEMLFIEFYTHTNFSSEKNNPLQRFTVYCLHGELMSIIDPSKLALDTLAFSHIYA